MALDFCTNEFLLRHFCSKNQNKLWRRNFVQSTYLSHSLRSSNQWSLAEDFPQESKHNLPSKGEQRWIYSPIMANDMLQYPSHLIADGVTLLLQLNGRQHQCLWLQVAGDYHLADVLLFFVAESCSIHLSTQSNYRRWFSVPWCFSLKSSAKLFATIHFARHTLLLQNWRRQASQESLVFDSTLKVDQAFITIL